MKEALARYSPNSFVDVTKFFHVSNGPCFSVQPFELIFKNELRSSLTRDTGFKVVLGLHILHVPIYDIHGNFVGKFAGSVRREQSRHLRPEFDVEIGAESFVQRPQWTCPYGTVADSVGPAKLLHYFQLSQKPYIRPKACYKGHRPRGVAGYRVYEPQAGTLDGLCVMILVRADFYADLCIQQWQELVSNGSACLEYVFLSIGNLCGVLESVQLLL